MIVRGRTIALYSDTGAGKTTQVGELAKDKFKRERRTTALFTADLGGYDSIAHLVNLGVVIPIDRAPEADPWMWIDDAVTGKLLAENVGQVAFDSGTSMGELLLNWITKDTRQIGQQKTQRFAVSVGDRVLSVGANNESHYGLVQSFLLDSIWRSTWLANKGIDVIWTFGLDRSEKLDSTPVIGPKLAGHALTSSIPKWFRYTFRLVSIPAGPGVSPRHVLYLQEQPEMGGVGMSFGNPRYPLGAQTELPATIEPANVVEALRLIEQGQAEAEARDREELGL